MRTTRFSLLFSPPLCGHIPKVFKKYSQMKLQMKREALEKMNRQANEMPLESGTATIQ